MKTKNDYRKREKSQTWDGVDLGLEVQRHGIAITKDISSEGMAVSHDSILTTIYFSALFCPLSLLSRN